MSLKASVNVSSFMYTVLSTTERYVRRQTNLTVAASGLSGRFVRRWVKAYLPLTSRVSSIVILIFLQSLIQEVEIGLYVLVVGTAAAERTAVVVE